MCAAMWTIDRLWYVLPCIFLPRHADMVYKYASLDLSVSHSSIHQPRRTIVRCRSLSLRLGNLNAISLLYEVRNGSKRMRINFVLIALLK